MRGSLVVLGLALSLSAVACGKENKVNVDCKGAETGFDCTATHSQGSDKVNTCWDVKVVCENGTVATGSACTDVAPASTAVAKIALADIKNQKECDKAKTTTVENLKLKLAN